MTTQNNNTNLTDARKLAEIQAQLLTIYILAKKGGAEPLCDMLTPALDGISDLLNPEGK